MKEKFIHTYMQIAKVIANLSQSRRLQVGAVVVKDNKIISCGYNGTPSGWETNNCEDETPISQDEYLSFSESEQLCCIDVDSNNPCCFAKHLTTKQIVIHAEMNCVAKLAQSNENGQNSTMFITHSPCIDCAKMIYQSGVVEIYFETLYRNDSGLQFLKKCGLKVFKIDKHTGQITEF